MNKEEVSVDVIILSQVDFKDNDAIINALSTSGKHYAFFARGIKKHTSKNASALQPFMKTTVTYFKSQKDMHLLKSAKVIESLYNFNHYDVMIAAHIVLDVINDISKMNIEDNEELYLLCETTLKSLTEVNYKFILSIFLIKIMRLLGLSLVVDHCAVCEKSQVNYISVKHGGFICHSCLETNDISNYNEDILLLFRIINKIDYNQLEVLNEYQEYSEIVLSLVYEFYISYSGFRIRNITEFI